MSVTILTTKLYAPPARRERVLRPRLIERLDEGLQAGHRLTLVSAPAGFGKTTLLSQWASGCGLPVAWLSLDEGDNDPAQFMAYLVAALRTVEADIGSGVMAAFHSPQPASMEAGLTVLINEIMEVSEPFVLVLDDCHLITSQAIHDGLTFLLDHRAPQMHLCMAGRADPSLSLARLRARGQLTELRVTDLRFTADETAAFLNTCGGLNLSGAEVAALDARTEGWIAGLQMAALSLRGRKDVPEFISGFTGTHRFILDYLVEEVLDQQSPGIQDFLLRTSVLERLTGPLCDAVRFGIAETPSSARGNAVTDGSDSQALLIQLEQDNLFLVPLDEERRWYRYHHLFADLLRGRLESTQPDLAPALHCRASRWYEEKGLIAEAVSYALAANDIERVVRLVAGNALSLVYYGELRTLVRQLAALPDEVVRSQPWLRVAHAWTLAYAGDFDRVEPLLQEAEESLVGLDGQIEDRIVGETEEWRMLGHFAAIRAYAAALKGEMPQAAELAREVLRHLPAADLMVRGYAMTLLGAVLRPCGYLAAAAEACTEAIVISQAASDSHFAAIAHCDLAALHFVRGQLREAAAACQDVQQIADRYGQRGGRQLPVLGYAYARLSAVLREWNELETAMRYAQQGLELCQQWEQADVLVYGHREVAKVRQALGDADGALDAIRKGKRIASSVSPWPRLHVAAEEAQLWLAQGNLAAASSWVQESGLGIQDALSFQHLFQYIALVRVLIAQGALHEALQLLKRLLKEVEIAGAMGYAIEIQVLQAMALQAQGNVEAALTVLERALTLAEPEGYVRTFVDEGEPMRRLLQQAAARGIALNYVRQLLAALESEMAARSVEPPLPEPLSEREREVLRLLATGLSNKEMAQTLFIAVGTVKQHLKSIYAKLEVHNRTEAANRARDLGLL